MIFYRNMFTTVSVICVSCLSSAFPSSYQTLKTPVGCLCLPEWMCAAPAVSADSMLEMAIRSGHVWWVTKRLCMSYYHRPSARILLYLCLLPPSVPSPPVVLNSHKDIEIQPQEMGAIKHKNLPQSHRVKCEPWCGQSKRNSRVHQISTWPEWRKDKKAIMRPWWS